MSTAPVVVLCRPQLGENVGTAARAMLNFGLTDMRLAGPAFGWPNGKAVVAASGATDVLNGLEVYPDLRAATADLHHLFATSARPREFTKPVLTPEAAAAEARRLTASGHRVAFVFGPERTGLTNDELLLADAIVTIPTNPDFASLNLAQAVLLCSYAWLNAEAVPPVDPGDRREPATKAEVAGLIEHLVRELDQVDFFRSADRRMSMVGAISLLFERRQLARAEVHLLRGIVKDLVGGRRARTLG